jgi:hypothetical protein
MLVLVDFTHCSLGNPPRTSYTDLRILFFISLLSVTPNPHICLLLTIFPLYRVGVIDRSPFTISEGRGEVGAGEGVVALFIVVGQKY